MVIGKALAAAVRGAFRVMIFALALITGVERFEGCDQWEQGHFRRTQGSGGSRVVAGRGEHMVRSLRARRGANPSGLSLVPIGDM